MRQKLIFVIYINFFLRNKYQKIMKNFSKLIYYIFYAYINQ